MTSPSKRLEKSGISEAREEHGSLRASKGSVLQTLWPGKGGFPIAVTLGLLKSGHFEEAKLQVYHSLLLDLPYRNRQVVFFVGRKMLES